MKNTVRGFTILLMLAASATAWAQIQAKKAAGDGFTTEIEGQYVDRLSGANDPQWLCAA
jgi:hypothetical protein